MSMSVIDEENLKVLAEGETIGLAILVALATDKLTPTLHSKSFFCHLRATRFRFAGLEAMGVVMGLSVNGFDGLSTRKFMGIAHRITTHDVKRRVGAAVGLARRYAHNKGKEETAGGFLCFLEPPIERQRTSMKSYEETPSTTLAWTGRNFWCRPGKPQHTKESSTALQISSGDFRSGAVRWRARRGNRT
jgi:hypothetical protein